MSTKRYLDGFQCLSEVKPDAVRKYPVAIGIAVDKGDLTIVTIGYIQLATTLATHTIAGVSQTTNTAAEAVADGTVNASVILLLPHLRWRCPVVATDLITVDQVGLSYNLSSAKGIDEAAATDDYYGFVVDEVDVSSEAVAVNTFGYAIGRFVSTAAS